MREAVTQNPVVSLIRFWPYWWSDVPAYPLKRNMKTISWFLIDPVCADVRSDGSSLLSTVPAWRPASKWPHALNFLITQRLNALRNLNEMHMCDSVLVSVRVLQRADSGFFRTRNMAFLHVQKPGRIWDTRVLLVQNSGSEWKEKKCVRILLANYDQDADFWSSALWRLHIINDD